jgi:murein DD-endopeptidase MepM/ murein hydrolase activator NlpD
MPRAVVRHRLLRWPRLAMVATISAAAAGCSADMARFDANPFGSYPQPVASEATGSAAQRHASVQGAPLPPPNTAAMQPPTTRPAASGSAGTAAVTGSVKKPGASPANSAPAGGHNLVHVVGPGETLMKLSRKYQKSLSEIARANNIPPYTLVKVGDRIVIPGVSGPQATQPRPSAPLAQQPKSAPPAPAPAPLPEQKMAAAPTTDSARMVTPAAQHPEPEKSKRDLSTGMPSFRWPVRGRVIAAFGPRPTGQRNDGINIAVPEGTPIKAAEDGVVAYAGNELKAYGNLVLVRHSNGFVTAYAHASEILVKRDEPVKRGQVIAKAGQTGTVAAPQLHFEIRKGSSPVDPLPFLDKGGNS